MAPNSFTIKNLVSGNASGPLLYSQTSLSFWGGVDQNTGTVIDHRHPLCGQSFKDKVLAIPAGRGSCTGSGIMLELLLSGNGPAALVLQHPDTILTLGVLVAQTLFNRSIPVVVIDADGFAALNGAPFVSVGTGVLRVSEDEASLPIHTSSIATRLGTVTTNVRDEEMLRGTHGPAAQMAMQILIRFAQLQGVDSLLDITQAHVDACVYIGPASLSFAKRLLSLGARFAVPTTMNSISLDYRRWNELGVTAELAQAPRELADTYMSMGAKLSFTCAPYLLDSAPKIGEQIGWAESNAVVFANSVLGAKTQKYPDFLDVCMAITGRAPMSGCHLEINRRPTFVVSLPKLQDLDDSAWPAIGYFVGLLAGPEIPFICGLEKSSPSTADLKAFSAAFATTASSPMFHLRGVTPESEHMEDFVNDLRRIDVSREELATSYAQLNTAADPSVGLISLGNPHFSIEEMAELARLCMNGQKHPQVKVVVTTNRAVQAQADDRGYLTPLIDFGVEVITDTCWCMIDEPIIPVTARNLMTNSAKYAHYAPGMVRRGVHFGSLAQCIEAARSGEVRTHQPFWLVKS